jgi:alpha-L-arabinofuranosidase
MSNGFVQPLGHHVRVSIENGRWYTMRVDVIGRDMKFYLDGNLLDEVIDTPGHPEKTVFASATKDSSSGAVWLHLVNTAAFAQPVRLDLTGSPRVDSTAAGQILKSDAASYNSITNPTLVVPQKLTIKHVSHSFVYTLPANSVAVIDIGIQQ